MVLNNKNEIFSAHRESTYSLRNSKILVIIAKFSEKQPMGNECLNGV
jgi:hypothetical protein